MMGFHIQQLKSRMLETWNNDLNVHRGNPVRTFSVTDFKNNHQEKSFKKQRNILKNKLKHYRMELNKSKYYFEALDNYP